MSITQADLEVLRKRLCIAVIYSGDPQESGNVINSTWNPRGWKSYHSGATDIAEGLSRAGFHKIEVFAEDRHLSHNLEQKKVDVAWLNCAGLQGYDGIGHAAAMLECLGVPYVGHRPSQSILLDNKYHFKMFASALGIPTSAFMFWDARHAETSILRHPAFSSTFRQCAGTFIVKPVSGRASNNISFVDNTQQLDDAILQLNHYTNNGALVEAYLPGNEYCVSASGGLYYQHGQIQPASPASRSPFCFSQLERILAADEKIFTSMDIKPITRDRVRLINPEQEAAKLNELNRITTTLYKALSLTAMVRADIREDSNGKMHILEINPKPDLRNVEDTSGSLFALGLAQSELSYEDMIASQLLYSIDHLLTYNEKSSKKLQSIIPWQVSAVPHAKPG